jgi:intein/homing endonuclease
MTQSEIEKLIAAERGVLEDALAVAIEKRDVANREIKRLREELDAAPRLHVRRSRKPKAELVSAEDYLAKLDKSDQASDGFLPGVGE